MTSDNTSDVYRYYLRDLGALLKEMALEAAAVHRREGTEFAAGYMMGFHRVISLMQQQTIGFGIPLNDLSLEDIDPERDLL